MGKREREEATPSEKEKEETSASGAFESSREEKSLE